MPSPRTQKYIDLILTWPPIAILIRWSQKISLPGFERQSLYEVTVFFIRGISKGALTMRASSMSFSFFLALFPTIIFFFTLIPYIPIHDFHSRLMDILEQAIPEHIYIVFQSTINDIVNRPRSGLLSLGFVLALYFSTNGINSMIEAFNLTYHTMDTRTVVKQRLISLLMVFIISTIVIVAILLISFGTLTLNLLVENDILPKGTTVTLLQFGKYLVILAMFYFSISIIYYLAPAKRTRFKFFSAGSSLATTLSILSSIGFDYYVSNFTRYNTLYGSIGTLLIVLFWIYFNSIIMLIGFELNASISIARRR